MKARYDLRTMLKPKSVAIIGASRNPDKVGHIILQNYLSAGYSGKLYPINPNADEILGLRAYKSVLDIKRDSIDLAVVAIPAELTPQALNDCGKAGIRNVVVVSGGFAEVGNGALQDKLKDICDKYGIAMIGPNCLGLMDTRSRIDTLFLPSYKISRPFIGRVSFVSQSGAVGSTILDIISSEGIGLSKFISYGNAVCVDEVDILEYLMADDETDVIVMYIEGIKRGKEFVEVARKLGKKKPVVILKAGRTDAGVTAAHSHTAALAGNYATQEAIFRQFGFTVAKDLDELLDYAKIFASDPEPKGNRVSIITNGGGTGVLTTDAVASSRSLVLSQLANETRAALAKTMPALVNVTNPLDLAGDADAKRYGDALTAVSADENTDILIVIALFQTPGADSKVAAELVHQKGDMDKPMVVISVGSDYTGLHKKILESGGVPVYESPSAAAKALEALFEYGRFRDRKP
ncbi:Acetate--CoA ligase [ADP-forming] II subunit alpha [uncultured archaeon]|nr:Acetate--CoA ligase [ADP-forming] II subunit alpha [uncultured archaeon]